MTICGLALAYQSIHAIDSLQSFDPILLWEPLKTPVEHLERQIYL